MKEKPCNTREPVFAISGTSQLLQMTNYAGIVKWCLGQEQIQGKVNPWFLCFDRFPTFPSDSPHSLPQERDKVDFITTSAFHTGHLPVAI